MFDAYLDRQKPPYWRTIKQQAFNPSMNYMQWLQQQTQRSKNFKEHKRLLRKQANSVVVCCREIPEWIKGNRGRSISWLRKFWEINGTCSCLYSKKVSKSSFRVSNLQASEFSIPDFHFQNSWSTHVRHVQLLRFSDVQKNCFLQTILIVLRIVDAFPVSPKIKNN